MQLGEVRRPKNSPREDTKRWGSMKRMNCKNSEESDLTLRDNLLERTKYSRIFINLCLLRCTWNLGQYAKCWSIYSCGLLCTDDRMKIKRHTHTHTRARNYSLLKACYPHNTITFTLWYQPSSPHSFFHLLPTPNLTHSKISAVNCSHLPCLVLAFQLSLSTYSSLLSHNFYVPLFSGVHSSCRPELKPVQGYFWA